MIMTIYASKRAKLPVFRVGRCSHCVTIQSFYINVSQLTAQAVTAADMYLFSQCLADSAVASILE